MAILSWFPWQCHYHEMAIFFIWHGSVWSDSFLFHLEKYHGPFTKKSYLLFQSMISCWLIGVCCNIVTLLGWWDISLGISRNMIQFGWNCTWSLGCLILMMVLLKPISQKERETWSQELHRRKEWCRIMMVKIWTWIRKFFSEAESRFFRCYSVCLKILISDSQKKVALMTSLLLQ